MPKDRDGPGSVLVNQPDLCIGLEQPEGLVTQLSHARILCLPFALQLADDELAIATHLEPHPLRLDPFFSQMDLKPAQASKQGPILSLVVGAVAELRPPRKTGGRRPPLDPVGTVGRARVAPASSIKDKRVLDSPGRISRRQKGLPTLSRAVPLLVERHQIAAMELGRQAVEEDPCLATFFDVHRREIAQRIAAVCRLGHVLA